MGEAMSKFNVLVRDHWICQLCGEETPRELRGMMDPRAPEVDHIIPESRGGSDNESNLRCVCRACNRKKSSFLDYELQTAFASDGTVVDIVAVLTATERQRKGAVKGGFRCHELHPKMSREVCGKVFNRIRTVEHQSKAGRIGGRKGGKIGGKTQGRINVESGQLASLRTLEHQSKAGRLANHNRWHIKRTIWNPNCKLCFEVI